MLVDPAYGMYRNRLSYSDQKIFSFRLWLATSLRRQKSEALMIYNSVEVVKFEEE